MSPAVRRLVTELRTLKDAHGLTFKQMGRLTHYSHASWERWLNGKRPVTREALECLLAAVDHDGPQLLLLYQDTVTSLSVADKGHAVEGAPAAASSGRAPAMPQGIAQLPMDLPGFTGRHETVRELTTVLTAAGSPGGQVPMALITGGGGLGKTALAVHAAHRIADRFPDGQFYADLRGADRVPRDPRDILGGWLRALGECADPAGDLEEHAAQWRSALHGRGVLLLLDNAGDAEQVRPLLPAASACAVIVTGRARFAELPGAHTFTLGPLSDAEALDLLAHRIGAPRLAREPRAAAEVVRACGGIPLAVQIAAARLAARLSWPIAAMADRLLDERRRLDELTVGDLAVRASFQLSYTMLGPAAGPGSLSPARTFRLLGLALGPDISLPAATALLDAPAHAVEGALEILVDAHLLQSPAPGRYRLHDLLRLYAAELAEQHEPPQERQSALGRIVDWYLVGTIGALLRLEPADAGPQSDAVGGAGIPVGDGRPVAALAWFRHERANLVAAISRVVDDALDDALDADPRPDAGAVQPQAAP